MEIDREGRAPGHEHVLCLDQVGGYRDVQT